MKLIVSLLLVQFVIDVEPPLATLYIFLSEDCPICQHYTLTLNQIHEKFKNDIHFVGVFPNETSSEEFIQDFRHQYHISFDCITDYDHEIRSKYDAKYTPEVILVNRISGSVYYRGAIDDYFAAIGKPRRYAKIKPYLIDAISQLKNRQAIFLEETKPIGCIINKVELK